MPVLVYWAIGAGVSLFLASKASETIKEQLYAFFSFVWQFVAGLLDPVTLIGVGEQILGSVMSGAANLLGGGASTDWFSLMGDFFDEGPLTEMVELAFYFASPIVYVPVLRPLIAALMLAWVAAACMKCGVWLSSLFWTKPT